MEWSSTNFGKWTCTDIEEGHNPMLSAPQSTDPLKLGFIIQLCIWVLLRDQYLHCLLLLHITLNYFDPESSSTSSIISCLDHKCRSIAHLRNVACPIDNYCSFEVQYIEGSMASGYFLSDVMHVANIVEGSVTPNSSVPLFFGCSNLQTGNLTMCVRAIDGIFGFGRHEMSFISQLHSEGVAPKIFSHSLKGDNNGGGILVLGEVAEPNIIYSPLFQNNKFVLSRINYVYWNYLSETCQKIFTLITYLEYISGLITI
ncbi:PREDICTED: aspartic proteinase-like protein 2 [Lupinus angustifolius]|uniref:aspartic proteinase-like protein 2 n=1 Tax=Lupinus angustifolius TaxID=3871 RepID=UPI00092F6836|nr:PREDICTED: aspartic proteinase-like protein 2 [Lupinus angustifolius]